MSSVELSFRELIPDVVFRACKALHMAGGKAYLVGGCVRDMLLGHVPKDFDIEVYGLPAEALEKQLATLGRFALVGKQFGVYKLWLDDTEIDIALPRTEIKTDAGHRGFSVQVDPGLSPEIASSRRDFTMNAMMYEPLDDELLDFHAGRQDLEQKVLRHVSDAFGEDPLRPLRGMQFAARFRLTLHPDTVALCRQLLSEATTLPSERIWSEWEKWAHAATPSFGLRALSDSGWLSLYPELGALCDCPQDPRWHPEGDVWTHTLLVVDHAAQVARRYHWTGFERLQLLLAALTHDLGKPDTTESNESGKITSAGHSQAGLPLARQLMQRIGAPNRLLEYLEPLIREHMTHMHGEPTERAVRRLSARLSPVSIEMWEALVEADASGRTPFPAGRPALPWLQAAKAQQVHQQMPAALVTGKMLIDLGLEPGPKFSRILKAAYEVQLEGEIHNEETAVAWCKKRLSSAH